MDRKQEEVRATIKGKLELEDLERAKLFYTMRLFKEAVEKAHHLIKKGIPKKEIIKSLQWTIPNSHYSEAAYRKACLYEPQNHLSLKNPLLFSHGKGAGRENGNRNIQIEGEKIKIKIPHADGKHEWIEGKINVQSKHRQFLDKLKDYGYATSISIKEGKYRAYINIPIELYGERSDKIKQEVSNIASFDLNSDRINMTLMRTNGLLSELIEYAVAQGVRTFVFEKLKMKGKKSISSKTRNRKMSNFAAREFISHAEIMIKKRGGEFKQVNPTYSSKNARIINQNLGMDVHTASALVLGLRYLHTPKTT